MSTIERTKQDRTEFYSDFGFTRRMADEAYVKMLTEKLPSAAPKAVSGDAVLSGYASTWVMDRDFEFISKHAYDGTLESYLLKNPIVLLQHDHDKVLGQIANAEVDATGLNVDAVVRKPVDRDPDWKHGAYNDILAGIYRTFSVGGYFYREIVDGEILVNEIELFEISVVAVPSNPDSIFEATQKAAKGLGMSNASGSAKRVDLMQQLLGMVPVTAPQLAGLPELAKRAAYYELAAGFTRETERPAPEFEQWRNVSKQLDVQGADAGTIAGEAERVITMLAPIGSASKASPQGVGAKAGRVLSKNNESKLTKAVEAAESAVTNIRDVLSKLPEQEEQAAEPRDLADLKGVFGERMQRDQLNEDLYTAFWALRDCVSDALGLYGPADTAVDLTSLAEACNEFRDWVVGRASALGDDATLAANLVLSATKLADALPKPMPAVAPLSVSVAY